VISANISGSHIGRGIMQEIRLTKDQAEKLQAFVTDHRNYCYTYLYDGQEHDDWEPYDVYDGCDVCETRESLMATFDWLKSNKIIDVYVE
jgi:hypothetical protein